MKKTAAFVTKTSKQNKKNTLFVLPSGPELL